MARLEVTMDEAKPKPAATPPPPNHATKPPRSFSVTIQGSTGTFQADDVPSYHHKGALDAALDIASLRNFRPTSPARARVKEDDQSTVYFVLDGTEWKEAGSTQTR